MFKITINYSLNNLNHLKDKISNLNPLFDSYDRIMRDSTYQKFDDRQGVWIPSISALKENRYTLVDSGDLRRSLSDINNSNHIKIIDNGTLTFGSNIPYAYAHNFGIDQVQRTFLDITDDDLNLLTRETLEYLIGVN